MARTPRETLEIIAAGNTDPDRMVEIAQEALDGEAQYVTSRQSRRWHRIIGMSTSSMLILVKCGQSFWRKSDDTYYGYNERDLTSALCKGCA